MYLEGTASRIHNQPEVQLSVGTFDVCVLVFSTAAIFLASVHEKVFYDEDVDIVFIRTTIHCQLWNVEQWCSEQRFH